MIIISTEFLNSLKENLNNFDVELFYYFPHGVKKMGEVRFNSSYAYKGNFPIDDQEYFKDLKNEFNLVKYELEKNIKLKADQVDLKNYFNELELTLRNFINKFKNTISLEVDEIDKFNRVRHRKYELYNPDFKVSFASNNEDDLFTLHYLYSQLKDRVENFYILIQEKYSHLDEIDSYNNKQISSFLLKDSNRHFGSITKLYAELKKKKLIDTHTKLASFRQIFANTKPKNRIKWQGKKGDLKTLINELYKQKVIETSEKLKWQTTAYCFEIINIKDGNCCDIDPSSMKGVKETTSAEEIKELVRLSVN